MTLSRPAYTVTVENHTAGWTYEATEGDDSTVGDDVKLVDPLSLDWSFEDGRAPGQLDPDQAKFALKAISAEVLPEMNTGDLVTVDLLRPAAVGPDLPYMRFVGRLTEPEVTPVVNNGVRVDLTANGTLADLNGTTVSDRAWPEWINPDVVGQPTAGDRVRTLAALAKANLTEPAASDPWAVNLGKVDDINAVSALELYQQLVNSTGIGVFVIRGLYGPQPSFTPGYRSNDSDLWFWPQSYKLPPPEDEFGTEDFGLSPFKLVKVGLVATLAAQPIDTDDPRQIPASRVRLDSTKWRKDRDSAINRITYQGIAPTSDPDKAAVYVAEFGDLVRLYGENGRTIETQVRDPESEYLPGGEIFLGDYWLPDRMDAVADWAVDSLTILTHLMTDTELDRYAPMFWPDPDDAFFTIPRRLMVLGTAEQYAMSPRAIAAVITGCTFTVEGGRITINPTLRAEWAGFKFYDAITGDSLAADANLSEVTWADDAALHIDPKLTWRDMALTTI